MLINGNVIERRCIEYGSQSGGRFFPYLRFNS